MSDTDNLAIGLVLALAGVWLFTRTWWGGLPGAIWGRL